MAGGVGWVDQTLEGRSREGDPIPTEGEWTLLPERRGTGGRVGPEVQKE